MSKAVMLVIDPQVDFSEDGNLPVPGGNNACDNIANAINKYHNRIMRMTITIDAHHQFTISDSIWWVDGKNNHPTPYTLISKDDVLNGKWRAAQHVFQQWSEYYVTQLETNGKYPLIIWPTHCLINRPGSNLHKSVASAVNKWELQWNKVHFVPKGSCIKTEHYGAYKADVFCPDDPTTGENHTLIDSILLGKDILISGLALDFCLANTIRDIAEKFTDEQVKQFVLLTDCTASVNAPGCEHYGPDFIRDMTARGMRAATSIDYFENN